MCLHDSDPDYYYMKGVMSDHIAPTGSCRLVRVSRNITETWTEYETPSMQASGGTIE